MCIRDRYKVLPAWGVTDYSDISNVTVDDQKIDEVHELDVDDKTYYPWIINDLKTRNKASEVRIESAVSYTDLVSDNEIIYYPIIGKVRTYSWSDVKKVRYASGAVSYTHLTPCHYCR